MIIKMCDWLLSLRSDLQWAVIMVLGLCVVFTLAYIVLWLFLHARWIGDP